MGALNLGLCGTVFLHGLTKQKLLSGVRPVQPAQIDNLADNELVALTLSGQKKAFEGIVRRYQKLVYNVVFQMVQSHDAALDLTQDTFLKAYKNLGAFRSDAKLKPWLLKIASNTTLNYIRDSKSRYFDSLEELLEESPQAEPSSADNVEAEVETRFSQAMLSDALKRLSPRHREIFVLRYQHDLSYQDIATVVDETESAIKSILFRVREKLRKILHEQMKVAE
jgi:RNA polymerase sigma-70 factor (ECF subfamily)